MLRVEQGAKPVLCGKGVQLSPVRNRQPVKAIGGAGPDQGQKDAPQGTEFHGANGFSWFSWAR
jgi:hypothetical protein